MDHVKNEGLDSVYFMTNTQDFSDPAWYPHGNLAYVLNAEEPISDLDIVIEGALAAGTLFRGDSLEDLQKQLGITDLVDTMPLAPPARTRNSAKIPAC